MPSGRAHLKIEAGLLFGWTALAGYLLSRSAITPEAVVSFTVAYALSMLFLSPDLDLARSRATRRWGIARWLWVPYALVFRHRGRARLPPPRALSPSASRSLDPRRLPGPCAGARRCWARPRRRPAGEANGAFDGRTAWRVGRSVRAESDAHPGGSRGLCTSPWRLAPTVVNPHGKLLYSLS